MVGASLPLSLGRQDMVLVPASSGVMGILPRHAPTVAQLRPGVVEVHSEGTKDKYFVSSGFAFVHKDRTDVCAVAAAPVRVGGAAAVAARGCERGRGCVRGRGVAGETIAWGWHVTSPQSAGQVCSRRACECGRAVWS